MTSRRTFLTTASSIGAGLALGARATPADAAAAPEPAAPGQSPGQRATRPLDILILGGTGFIGPYQVNYAVSRGHKVTVFNRGRRQTELPRSVIHLQGDRNGQLDSLRGKKWDAVIDNSATDPAWVKMSAELLKDAATHYMFVSSTGVFLPYLTRDIDESVQPRLVDNEQGETKSYGVQKALSERETMRVFGDRGIVVRPHYIVGANDPTDRFPYWPVRIARGGEILVPGKRDDWVQIIDVRDLTEWMIRLLENGTTGTFNAGGPRARLTMEQFVYGIAAGLSNDRAWTWVDDYDFLAAQKLMYAVPWVMPRGDTFGMSYISSKKAIASGLTYRPLADTVKATLDWWPTVPEARRTAPRFVLTPERETQIIQAWKARGP